MSDSQAFLTLQKLVRRECASRLQYVGDAFPWTSAAGDDAVVRLRRIVQEDRDAINQLAQFLARHRYPVSGTPSYPASYTAFNFLSLEHMIPLLIADVQGSITYLTDALPQLAGEGKSLVETMLAGKRKHLTQLQELQTVAPAPAAS